MQIHEGTISVDIGSRTDIGNVTPEVAGAGGDIGVPDGIAWASMPHATTALTTDEYTGKLHRDGELDFNPTEVHHA